MRRCVYVEVTPLYIYVSLLRGAPAEVFEELAGMGFRQVGDRDFYWHVRKDDPYVRANVEKLYEIKDDESKNVEFWRLYMSTLELMEKRLSEMKAKLLATLLRYQLEVCKVGAQL